MQVEQEPVLVQELRSWVARDKGLHSQAAGLSAVRMHHSVEEGILPACQAEREAAAWAQEGMLGPVVLEAGGCSGPWMWEASELWEEVDRRGRGVAGMEGAAVGVAWGLGTGQRELRLEEDQEEEMNQAERKEGVLEMERSPGQGEVGRT